VNLTRSTRCSEEYYNWGFIDHHLTPSSAKQYGLYSTVTNVLNERPSNIRNIAEILVFVQQWYEKKDTWLTTHIEIRKLSKD
jgi:hypothetical protein